MEDYSFFENTEEDKYKYYDENYESYNDYQNISIIENINYNIFIPFICFWYFL